jgi:hypothetical protein
MTVGLLFAALGTGLPFASAESVVLGPPNQDGPTVVRASFRLRDINAIDDEAETFEFSGVLTLRWLDERKAFDPEQAGVRVKIFQGDFQFNEVSPAWFPQVVLANESGLFQRHGVILRVLPDGTSTLTADLNAVAEADLDLRRYPFDQQRLEAVFEVLGVDTTEVVLEAAEHIGSPEELRLRTPQWTLTGVRASTMERAIPGSAEPRSVSAFVLSVDVERRSFFVVRLIVIPLALIVMLSWSVFWMDRSSIADRINLSFIGILTAVAYQIVVSDIQPHISYVTLLHGFLNLSLLLMGATVVVNLVVGALDQRGQAEAGDRLDRICRWAFPATYFGLSAVMALIAFTFF